MRPKDENKENAIRLKAMEMIVKHGFEGLSMQKLAKAANVSPATIYIYFKNREDLLNKIFIEVQEKFTSVALEGFKPELSFEQGLWIQWKNRLKFIVKYPIHFSFYEQFRSSPLIDHDDVRPTIFKENMKNFVINAIKRGEIQKMDPEIYWSIAYGTFYSLVNFHLKKKTMMSQNFVLTENKMKIAFNMMIKSFK